MAIFLYWWHEKRKNGEENYGDLLSKYLVKKISEKKVIDIKHPAKGLHKYFFKHYVVIGSIISSATKKSIVWGSGIIKSNDNIRNAEFTAVRGPKTRARILEKGFECPEVYGDPGLLLPLFYKNSIKIKTHKIGIIPHYVDYKAVSEQFIGNEKVKVINLLTNEVEKTTDEILQCENIISSSLHGVIIAQAYNIPSLWIRFSDKLSGDNIKFYDYFESLNIDFKDDIFIEPRNLSIAILENELKKHASTLLPEPAILEHRQNELLKHCPFAK